MAEEMNNNAPQAVPQPTQANVEIDYDKLEKFGGRMKWR